MKASRVDMPDSLRMVPSTIIFIYMFLKILKITGKVLGMLILIFAFAIVVTSVSLVYDYPDPQPFSGPDIFNPYAELDSTPDWKRANFHTHTRVSGPLNECEYDAAYTDSVYRRLDYDIVTFSNHNELTEHPYDPALQVNVYEHGYNLFKYHKLVFNPRSVDYFDNLLPLFTFQKQYQLDRLSEGSDFIQLNHPFRTNFFSEPQLRQLEGFRIMELDSGVSTENEYWDWSLSSGHYSFGLANDDLHYPDRSYRIGVRCNFLETPSARYSDLKDVLLSGCYYSMRVPDYGDGDWTVKLARQDSIPKILTIGINPADSVFVSFTTPADSIKFIGQDATLLTMASDTASAAYKMQPTDPYTRIIAYFPAGEVIYSNPFARYDASKAETPYREPSHTVNIAWTILFNLILLLLAAGLVYLAILLIRS